LIKNLLLLSSQQHSITCNKLITSAIADGLLSQQNDFYYGHLTQVGKTQKIFLQRISY